ncbi:MAG: rhodanese-like domain-containing protein [Candidatus Competibacteraceae bacterium]|jgi:PQQ-dependent catabolism-associated CXXCW motif protein|nr:rhodanese-like domain-containing protein [Candidatus Competibacteraceae bacterium]
MNVVCKLIVFLSVGLFFSACASTATQITEDNGSAMTQLAAKQIENKAYADEDRDWSTAPTDNLKVEPYHSPTPSTHPDARLINTFDLREMILSGDEPVVINVLGTSGNLDKIEGIPSSVWMKGGGLGTLDATKQKLFADALTQLTGGNSDKALVFYCLDARCWLSYNSATRAHLLGYSNVYWYRGGIASWWEAGLPLFRQPVAYDFL